MKKEKQFDKAIEILQEEVNNLRDLKEKGKFGLQQAEYSLKRLAEKLINKINNYNLTKLEEKI